MKPKPKPAADRNGKPAKHRARPQPKPKPPNRLPRPPRPLTAAQARRIAARYEMARRFSGATVKRAADVSGYYCPARRADVWFVYPNSAGMHLGPDEIIAVCARTGRVLGVGRLGE
jgi:hypothetical protein